ncbi:MAG: hypothetical protein A2Z44_04055 [Betaproteobacteria bacterium RBG_19FT_COMBO_58_11]|nr:MAG: hypothetical protein A2Z44_04055 [Betaproteobacteria bacterium RBG_19FT_COMBO_58_11]
MTRTSTTAKQGITPFWNRIPRFFLYPFGLAPLLYMGVLSAVSLMTLLPIVGPLVQLLIWATFLRYSFVVLEHTSYGHLEPPGSLGRLSSAENNRPYKQLGIFILMGASVFLVGMAFGGTAALIAGLLLGLALPACIMLLAINDGFFQALNPLSIIYLISKIGLPYVALCFFLLSLSGGSEWFAEFLAPRIGKWALFPALNFIAMYFTLIMYNMMGYVLYQNHQSIGLDVQVDFADSPDALHKHGAAPDPLTAELNQLLAAGHTNEAVTLLAQKIRNDWENNDLHDRYHKLLILAGRKEVTSHGREYISKLVRDKKQARALDIYQDCLKADREFMPQEAAQVYPLACAARDLKQHKLALSIMRKFDKNFPRSPDIPSVYLLSAKLMYEEFRDEKMARAILHHIQKKYPQHPLSGEAGNYLAFMDKLAPSA